uniref:Rap guanine nucleotide exchange factor 2-like n=1 Tax=Phallusia mammillata TaxID=59560 RepID=A0A6F9DR18_9ASCI|nr:rap guanine nucleotide exchange factor 2-like [Phallusia mammillata]
MSLGSLDKELLFALRTPTQKRTERELSVIYSSLCRLETLSSMKEQSLRTLCSLARYETHNANEILFRKDDPCRCWYILMCGSVFIQGSMFLPYACFGKQIPGTKRRGCQCLVLEPSEMIAIDYPDMTLHSGGITTRPHAFRHSSSNSASSTLDSVIEVDSTSSESLHSSPMHQAMATNLHKAANGQVTMRDDISQSSFSKDIDDGEEDMEEPDIDEDDSISLHSTSSIVIKDLVIEVLKKDIADRNGDDLEILLEFTKSLRAFSNMTEPIRRALCKVMVFAWVEKAGTVVLKDDELLDSWSVIINGQVQVKTKDGSSDTELVMGDSFGVEATLQSQNHKGVMYTCCDDCQFLCIAQQEYYDVLHQGQENIQNITDESGQIVMVKEKREFDGGAKKGNIVIRGNADSLLHHLLEDNTIDATYTDDFLLTYRAFGNEPRKICSKLLEWFDNTMFRDKVIRVILLWVNNHFNDFECDWRMMALLEKFEGKLHQHQLQGEMMLFNIACNAKAKPRTVSITRQSNEVDLGFEIIGGSENNFPIYIDKVKEGSSAEEKGVKRGDLLMEVNGQNFEKLSKEKAHVILNKNTELNMTLKTSLFPFKQMVEELSNPQKKKKGKGDDKMPHAPGNRAGRMSLTMLPNDGSDTFDTKHRKGGSLSEKTKRFISKFNVLPKMLSTDGVEQVSVDDSMLGPQSRPRYMSGSATIDGPRSFFHSSTVSLSNPDLLDPAAYEMGALSEVPEDVIKVYRADQTHRFVCVNRDTTAGDAVVHACKEYGIIDDVENYALYKVSVQGEKFVKQSKLPDPLAKLANIPLGSRYYLKNTMNSEQLLPDENIPELLKEANFSFLDLNCFEVALHLTREDYKMFQQTQPTNFIEDLFHLDAELTQFKDFEELVNRELFWVVTTICKEPNLIQRSKIIKHFIKIAQHCKIIKNLNSTFALVSGLGYRAVSRMKQTWEKVPAKSTRLFEELQALMDPSRNMSKYRTLLNDYISQPPVIPYIPVVKKDLYFLHLGNDTIVDGLINFEKMRMIGKEIRNICRLCVADSSQIIPSAAVTHQKELDKGTSSMYMTLTRRGRRSSFNNAKRMYEDQMNVRRVKQYMQQMEIINDEDKLMEMSKAVEPPLRVQQNRRQATDSPSRSSKTLPMAPRSGSSSSGSGTLPSRNNSEPHLASVPVIALHPTKKKIPVSSLPKFGAQSPQALKKLMALSEEGDGRKSREYRRSESSSSHELSPTGSPYLSPKHDDVKGAQGNHTVGLENVNRNNNRLSLPSATAAEPSPPAIHSAPATNKRFFPVTGANNSAPSSSRSSIASTSSLGTISSSNPTLSSTSSLGGGNSPRSGSPVPWTGSVGSLSSTASASPRLLHGQQKNPQRSSSSSSADTVKSAGGRHHHERPVIKQNRNARSGSFGGSMISAMSDRRLAHISTSTSTPSLNAPGAGSQASLILPNHPQIPRTPSIDSGVVSAGSLSADSTIFTNSTDDADIFARGYHSHQYHQHHHHHQPNRTRKNEIQQSQQQNESSASTSTDRQRPPAVTSHQHDSSREGDPDKVEQTFLSGFRGQGDPPRPDNKDPYLASGGGITACDGPKLVGDMSVYHPGHVPPGGQKPFGALKGIHDYLICERHAAARRQFRTPNYAYNYTQTVQQYSPRPEQRHKSPDAILEEQLLFELQQQRPAFNKQRRKQSPPPDTPTNLVDVRRLSLSKSDPSLHNAPNWESVAGQEFTASAVRPSMRLPLPNRTSSPKGIVQQNSLENMSPYSPVSDNVFMASQNNHLHSTPTGRAQVHIQARESPNTTPNGPARRFANDQSFNWQYPGQNEQLSKSANNIPFLPQALNDRLNATMPTMGHYAYNRSPTGHFTEQSYTGTPGTHHRPVKSSSFDIYNAQPTNHVSGSVSREFDARRKTSQDWSETDLDGDKLQQTMKAWGSSTSLPATPLSTKSMVPNSKHHLTTSSGVAPNSSHSPGSVKKSSSRLPPPAPPQRTSSIGRSRQLRLGSGSSSPHSSPPMSPSSTDGHVSFDDVISQQATRISLPPSGQLANGNVVHHNRLSFSTGPDHKASSNERRSLPSYTEAVKQIKQKNMFPSPLPKSYRSFTIDPHENQEQVSQV